MTIVELMNELQGDDWESLSADVRTLKEWIIIARAIRSGGMSISKSAPLLVARIQTICVEAGLIDNEAFVQRVQA